MKIWKSEHGTRNLESDVGYLKLMSSRPGTGSRFGRGIFAVVSKILMFGKEYAIIDSGYGTLV